MARDLDPIAVARRLAEVAGVYVAETVAEGRARLLADEMEPTTFALLVAQRLEEVRALDELARYLGEAHAALRNDSRATGS